MVRWTKSIYLFVLSAAIFSLMLLQSGNACYAQTGESRVTLLEFSSPSCGPCHAMRPTMRRLRAAGYSIQEIDVTREPALARQFHVMSWPTFITVVDGREVGRIVGKTSQVQLQEMMAKSAALAERRPPAASPQGELSLASNHSMQPVESAQPAASQPWPGRMVDIQPPDLDNTYQQALNRPTPNRQASAAPAPSSDRQPPAATGSDQLIAATVRLTVADPKGQSTGTGTVVDSREGSALVLTCGHLFRDSQGKGTVEVTLFQAGPNGAEVRETVVGEIEDYDLERDLALVSFSPRGAIQVAAIAPPGAELTPGARVTTVGCNKGANPTALATQITAIDRYQGFPNVEAAGAPIEGRSGGGMFNAAGQLVGVCFAADHQGNEGLYAALGSIYAKLDSLNLAMIYRSPKLGTLAGNPTQQAFAAAPAPQEPVTIRMQGPEETPAWPEVNQSPAADPGTMNSASAPAPEAARAVPRRPLSAEEQAALEEIRRRGAKSEVVCIIRPQTPGGKSEVITLGNASPEFVKALTQGAKQ